MPLIERSYERQEKSLDGKSFICRKLYSEYLDKNPFCYGYDIKKGTYNLTNQGKWMIKTFIETYPSFPSNFFISPSLIANGETVVLIFSSSTIITCLL